MVIARLLAILPMIERRSESFNLQIAYWSASRVRSTAYNNSVLTRLSVSSKG